MAFHETLAAFRRGDNVEAGRLAGIDLDQAIAASSPSDQVDALCMLARVALRDGRLDEVEVRSTEASRVARAAQNDHLERMPLHLLAVSARMTGRLPEARGLYLRSISLNDRLGEVRMAAVEHRNLAYVEIRDNDIDRARELFAQAQARLADVDHALGPYLRLDQAVLACLDGDDERAARLLRDVEREFLAQGAVPDPDDAMEMRDLRDTLRARLGPQRFEELASGEDGS